MCPRGDVSSNARGILKTKLHFPNEVWRTFSKIKTAFSARVKIVNNNKEKSRGEKLRKLDGQL